MQQQGQASQPSSNVGQQQQVEPPVQLQSQGCPFDLSQLSSNVGQQQQVEPPVQLQLQGCPFDLDLDLMSNVCNSNVYTSNVCNVVPCYNQQVGSYQDGPRMPVENLKRPILDAPAVGLNGLLIHIILDESGSMGLVRDLTIDNFNKYIKEQQDARVEVEGAAVEQPPNDETKQGVVASTQAQAEEKVCISLTKFDAPKILPVYDDVPLNDVPMLSRDTYNPSGGTNLLDAIGVVVQRIDDKLYSVEEKCDRPSVFVVIITDGEENESHSFTMDVIKDMIQARQTAGWTFVFMGANIDAWSAASGIGVQQSNAFNFSASAVDNMAPLSKATVNFRGVSHKAQQQAAQKGGGGADREEMRNAYQQQQSSFAFFSDKERAFESAPRKA